MARMVPERPANTASAAEVLVFNRIRDELSAEWIALHSVGLTIHEAKPWAEIDFVLIGPPGVFCLEVKGGVISRDGGVWYTTPQHGPKAGKRQRLKESPFQQVASASAELFEFLDGRCNNVGRAITGFAVATPEVVWKVQGPDIDLPLVYDQADTLNSFDLFMQRVTRRWSQKVGSNWKRQLETLGRLDKQSVLDAIRGDFQLVPTLRTRADTAGVDLVRLTDEQCSLFTRLASNPRVFAKGGAGTGKTVIAVEEVRRLAKEGERVLYTCYSRNLAKHVASLLSTEPLVTVRTLHGLMMDLVTKSGRRSQLPDASEEDLMSLFLPELALELILESGNDLDFDVVVVDEGQDLLLDSFLDVIEALVGGNLSTGRWRLFLDPNQNIFGGLAASALERIREANPVEWPLTVNCRNTAPIAAQVSMLSGVPLSQVLAPSGPDVEVGWYDSADDQRGLIVEVLRKLKREGFVQNRIVVLSRYRLDASVLRVSATRVTDISRGRDDDGGSVRFSTVASFKGLESDVVVLADVDDLFSNEGLASVYVGSSRARVALFVFIRSTQKKRLQELAKDFGRGVVEGTA